MPLISAARRSALGRVALRSRCTPKTLSPARARAMLVAAPKPEDAPRMRAQPLSEIGCDSVGILCISLAARVPVPRTARAFYHSAAACYHEAPMGRTAGIILIGNELLSGKVVDANAAYLCRELRALGVDVRRIVVIPDEVDQIAAEVAQFSGRFDVVFTSGGVGPTHDDVTIEGVARAFGVPVVRDARMVEVIQRFSGANLNAARLRMAEIPEGALPMMGDGLVFPAVVMRNVYVLPGVPELFRKKFEGLKERFRDVPFHLASVFVSVGEGSLAEHLNGLLERHPELLLGSYPEFSNPEYRVKVTLESKDRAYMERALEDFLGCLPPSSVVRVQR